MNYVPRKSYRASDNLIILKQRSQRGERPGMVEAAGLIPARSMLFCTDSSQSMISDSKNVNTVEDRKKR